MGAVSSLLFVVLFDGIWGERVSASLTYYNRIAANVLWLQKINRDKASGKYAQFEGCGDDRDPEFRMVL
jgi:hypothetical protein